MLEQITPVVLTYNEAPNIGRTLNAVSWAGDIVVIDSFSDDATLAIAAEFPQVRLVQRRFDSLENQCNFALKQIPISTEWVLALDADYVLTREFVEELRSLDADIGVNGFRARFIYCIEGKRLRGSAYPPVTVLYRHKRAFYRQDGHAHRVVVEGEIRDLRAPILHDDRKPLDRWLRSQDIYMQQELQKLSRRNEANLTLADRLRKTLFIFPFIVFFYCLFVKRAILDGWPGLFYSFQRMLAEIILALRLIENRLQGDKKHVGLSEMEHVDETGKVIGKAVPGSGASTQR